MSTVFRKAFPRTIPVLAGYVFLGIAYGVGMRAKGIGMGWSLLCSTVVYGGSMQFAMIDYLAASFAPLTIALLTVLVQARHLFYGLSMLGHYADTGIYKPYLIFSLTDETYSLVCNGAPKDVHPGKWYTAVSLLDQCYWVTGTLLGALIGELLPTELLTGIDFSMTALFVVIVTEQSADAARKVRARLMSMPDALFAPLLGGGATLLSLLLVGPGSFLLLAMALILVGFFLRYRFGKEGKGAEA